MSDDAKVPLPKSTAAWVDDPQHPMSRPGDPMRRWTGEYTADDLRAVERAARAAAFREAADICMLFDATHPHGLADEFQRLAARADEGKA